MAEPTAGDVVPQSGGIRKVRWTRPGSGKSGGVRVIYYKRMLSGEIVLLKLFAKAKTDNLTGTKLKALPLMPMRPIVIWPVSYCDR